MEFEQSFAGSGEWHFPSPTATPTHASYGSNVLQTPKTASFPSHFQDAFNTPQMPGYATPQQPQYGSVTPLQRPHSSSETLRSNFNANLQAGGAFGNAAFANPVHEPVLQSSPPQGSFSSSFTQMQTPPPTRGSSVKKPQQMQVAFGTPSTIASRRFATPQQQPLPTMQETTPIGQSNMMQYPHMHFSPDMYQYAPSGPATAPVMPQMHSFWDPSTRTQHYNEQGGAADMFAPIQPHNVAWPSASMSQFSGQAMSFDTPAMTSFPIQSPHPRPSSAVPLGSNVPFSQTPQSSSASLDPSLIYSSPIRPSIPSMNRPSKPRSRQTSTAIKRKDSAEPDLTRVGTISPADNIPAISGPGLRRSNTTGAVRSKSVQFPLNPLETSNGVTSLGQAPRTSSPLKRIGKTPLGSISEHKPQPRASVVLTIDENGRARTETRDADGNSPTKSVRERYPGLFDSDSSDGDESDTSERAPSRSGSFAFARSEERRTKAARLDPPLENLEGLSIPRSHSSASTRSVTPSRAAIAAVASLRKQGSLRRPSRISPAKRGSISSKSAAPQIDSHPMDASAEWTQPTHTQTGWTGVSGDFTAMGLGSDSYAHDQRSFHQAPSHTRQHSQPMLVRCPCGTNNTQGAMLQCTSCTQWLHAPCLGIEPHQPLPTNYTCFLCTKPRNSAHMSSSRR